MEVIFSAGVGELASRSISFLMDRYLKQKAAPTEEERLRSLERLLLRLRVVVEEADGRLITSQAMLHQLSILKKEMYRGYYTLDVFRYRAHGEDRAKDHQVNNFFAPSESNPAKRVCFCSGNNQGAAQAELLKQVLCSESAPGAVEDLAVLPIIGPGKTGKSTLIEHACHDERVRNHFSQILGLNGNDLEDASVETLRDGGRIKYQNRGMGGGRTLIIIELVFGIKESVWKKLYSAARSCIVSGSKIIIASRSDKIASFGTTQPLRLQLFTQEAYWYFFKVRTFGSTSVEDNPKLAAIAMDMATVMNGCFRGAIIISGLLKANFNLRFWSMALATLRNIHQSSILLYGDRLADTWDMTEQVYLRRVTKTSSECFVILSEYQTCSAETELEHPEMMSVQDLLFGSVRPRGDFKVHAWTSHLPPHYSYMFHCRIQRSRRMVTRNKRFQKSTS
ncbi:hypothetical protein ACQ4PT_069244 [Festuca glaucescens]